MNSNNLLSQLVEKGIISDAQSAHIKSKTDNQPFPVHWELRSLSYLGITLLSTGLGILIYKNIDTIGHNVLIGFIALVCLACFYYAYKHRKPFSTSEIDGSRKLEDFALLGACLAFLTLEGYLQYQYTVFGTRYGLAAFIPALVFFFCAYRFDHRGVLSMAITAMASGVGVSIAPVKLWKTNDFNSLNLTISAILLGVFLIFLGWLSERKNFKKHFCFTYFFLGGNLAFIAALAGLFQFDYKPIYFLAVAVLTALNIIYAREQHSYIFMLMGVIYGYIAFTYSVFSLLPDDLDVLFAMFYFILSGGGVILFLFKIKGLIGLKK